MMRIQTNVPSLNARTAVEKTTRDVEKSSAEMASGSRINKAADDAARLAISKQMEMNIRSGTQASRNALDAVSVVQIAEGSFNEMNTIVIRLRELGMVAASDTVGDDERRIMNNEARQLREEMDRIGKTTTWNARRLLNGDGDKYSFQVGINNNADNSQVSVNFSDIDTRSEVTGVSEVDLSTRDGARSAITYLDQAQDSLSGRRATLGSIQNRLQSTMDNLGVQNQNLSSANSVLRDTDYSEATSRMVKGQILQQAGVATLAQANQNPLVVLKLFQN